MKSLLVFPMLVLCACGTEQTRTSFPVELSASTSSLVTDTGWSVTLTKSIAHLSALRFFEGKVLLSQRSPWWRSLIVSEAWAHPGHYIAGDAKAELLTSFDLDLLAPGAKTWGTAEGTTGSYGSAQLTFDGLGFELEGTATKAGQVVEFAGNFKPIKPLEGIRFEREMTTAAGVVLMNVNLNVVLSRMDFAQVGAGAKPLDVMSPAFNGFARGVDDTSGYLFTWKDN